MSWIKCSDKLPDANTDVLCLDKGNIWVATYVVQQPNKAAGCPDGRSYWTFKTDNDNCCSCVCPDLNNITHWMELPLKPQNA